MRQETRKNLLVVDDDPSIGNLLETILQGEGYDATHIDDPLTALDKVKDAPENIDAAIVDYAMPKLNGIEFVTEARKIREDLKILMCSALPEKVIFSLREQGLVNIGVVAKPFEVDDIITRVDSLFASNGINKPK